LSAERINEVTLRQAQANSASYRQRDGQCGDALRLGVKARSICECICGRQVKLLTRAIPERLSDESCSV